MRNWLIFLGSLGASLGTAQAQVVVSVGPRLGGNLATGTFNLPERQSSPGHSYSYSHSSCLGYQVGLAASFGWRH